MMEENKNQTSNQIETSNPNHTPKKKEAELNIVDLFFYLLHSWKWYLLSLTVFIGLAYLRYARIENVYVSSLNVYLKDFSGTNGTGAVSSTVGFERFNSNINRVNVSNEKMKLASKRLLETVVSRLGANMSYKMKIGLRMQELYKRAPLSVCFVDSALYPTASLTATLKDYRTVVLSDFDGNKWASMQVPMNRMVKTPAGRIIIRPTKEDAPALFGAPIYVTKSPIRDVARAFHDNLLVTQEIDESSNPTSVLTLKIHDLSPDRARDVLATLITVYNENAIKEKNRIAVNTASFINNRIAIIGQELGNVESDMAAFQTSNKVMDIQSSTAMYMNKSQQYSQSLEELDIQMRMARYVKSYLANPAKGQELIPSNLGLKDADVQSQIAQYNALKLRRDRLAGDESGSNPVVLDLGKTLAALRHSIIRSVDNVMSNIRLQRNELSRGNVSTQAQVATLPVKKKQYVSIERQQKIKDDLYTFLLNKREENALTQAMVDNNAQVIDTSDGDACPISPNRNKNLLLGLLAGLFLPTVVLLMRLFLDTRVRSRKDIVDALSVPFLGTIPLSNKSLKEIEKEGENGVIAEAFRMLRTNLTFLLQSHQGSAGGHVITVSSFLPDSGKTFITILLMRSLRMAGKRVLLVDLDLRKRTLSSYYHLSGQGMSNYLADESLTPADVIRRDPEGKHPDIIGAGHEAPNPAELLMNERLDGFIREVRGLYDYILVDNVPFGMIADSSITNRITDLTLFVVRAGRLDRRQLPQLEQLYSEKKLNNMSVVLNGAKSDGGKYGYGYDYGYGYGYGYAEKKHKKHILR